MPEISIEPVKVETLAVPIVGTAPLIMHRFDEKAKATLLDNMQGRKKARQIRDPQADYEAAFYRLDAERYGFPATGFKLATIGGARFYGKAVTMASLRQFLWFKGEVTSSSDQPLVHIVGEPKMREDVVRVGQGTDLRYRPEFREWWATLVVSYPLNCLDRGSVLSLIEAGGMGVGVGEWRPEKRGDFGTYRIDVTREIEAQ